MMCLENGDLQFRSKNRKKKVYIDYFLIHHKPKNTFHYVHTKKSNLNSNVVL